MNHWQFLQILSGQSTALEILPGVDETLLLPALVRRQRQCVRLQLIKLVDGLLEPKDKKVKGQ